VNALVVSRIDYCNAVLAGVHDVHLRQLQRVLTSQPCSTTNCMQAEVQQHFVFSHNTGVLHWLPIRQHVEFKLSVLVFNCLHNLAPSYLSTMCQPVADSAGRRHLRSAARGAVPVTRTLLYGPRSFAVAGPSSWNSLPAPLRSCHLPSSFHRDLKTELFIRTYHQHAHDCF